MSDAYDEAGAETTPEDSTLDDLVRRANQPNLGLATTKHLLEELISRTQVELGEVLIRNDLPEDRQMSLRLAHHTLQLLKDSLHPEDLAYRTVDS